MTYITQIHAREILDSRGMPTVEVDVVLENGHYGRAVAPSGASTGKHEAVEIRDNNPDRFLGKGVLNVIASIHEEIAEAIIGHDAFNQKAIDSLLIELDGTANKSRLGANATLPVSLACAKAAAASLSLPLYRYLGGVQAKRLPLPFMNIINGGSHADNNLSIQEFMIVPIGADQFSDAIRMGAEIFHKLKLAIKEKGHHVSVGDEGGFAPQITTSEQALDLILSAIEAAGYVPGDDVSLALDVAANELLKDDQYLMDGNYKNREQMISFYSDLIDKYPIISIEDPFAENDWESWIEFTSSYGHALQIVGDDLFVTNLDRLQQGIETNAANTILIKPNQVGTLSETLETISVAQFSGIGTMVSHRSGETEDTTIADLTVATNAGQIKTGSLSRSERLCKYNQLLRISEDLGVNALFG